MTVRRALGSMLLRVLYRLSGPGQGIRVVLLYHSVGSARPQSIDPLTFEWQMKALSTRFQIVRLGDLSGAIASALPRTNLAAVTFDDGYLDNYEHALPILEATGIKATFFIATGYLGKTFPTFSGELPMLSACQVRALGELGHEIGAHTVNHPRLTQVSLESARQEMAESRAILEDMVGSDVFSFAYPKGDHDEAVKDLARAIGFRQAVSVRENLLDRDPDWLSLPRVAVDRSVSHPLFRAKVSPAIRWYATLLGRG